MIESKLQVDFLPRPVENNQMYTNSSAQVDAFIAELSVASKIPEEPFWQIPDDFPKVTRYSEEY